MATPDPDIINQLNRLLVDMNSTLGSVNANLSTQVEILEEIRAAGGFAAGSVGDATEGLSAMAEGADAAAASVDGMGASMKQSIGVMDALKNAGGLLRENLTTAFDALSGPVNAFVGLVSAGFDVMMSDAVKFANDSYDFARSLEEIRDRFGDLALGISSRVVASGRNLGASLREAAGGAAVFASKFSMGVAGAVEMLEKMSTYAENLGPLVDVLGSEFGQAAAETFALREGLAFTGEALKMTATLARNSSLSLKGFQEVILRSVNQIGRSFGMSTKQLGKDVGDALSSFKILGKMTGNYVEQVVKSAAFTRKLGIELKDLASLADKFDDFEQGAEAAAQLAQGFGLVIDPLKMFQEQDPARRLDELRKAFIATGRSVDSMTRQERSLLAQTSGLNDEQVLLAFSNKGLGLSYEQVAAQATAAQKEQKSQAQIMQEVADNIKNVVNQFEVAGSFFEQFMQGIGDGIKMSPEYQALVRQLGTSLLDIGRIGREVGQILTSIFLGDNPIGSAIKDFISLIAGKDGLAANLSRSFRDMIKAIKDGDIAGAVEGFTKKLGDLFLGTFSKGQPIFEKILTGLGEMLKGVLKSMPGLIRGLTGVAKDIITSIIGALKDSTKAASETGEKTLGQELLSLFKETLRTLKDSFDELKPLLSDLGRELMTYLGEALSDIDMGFVMGIFAAPVAAIFGASVGNIFDGLANMFSDKTKVAEAANNADIPSALGSTVTSAVNSLGAFPVINEAGLIAKGLGIAAMSVGVYLVGGAIRDFMASFMTPEYDDGTGKKVSFVDLIASSAKKFESVKAEDFMLLGALFAGVSTAIGVMMYGMVQAIDKLSTTELFLAYILEDNVADMIRNLGTAFADVISAVGLSVINIVSTLKFSTIDGDEKQLKDQTGKMEAFSGAFSSIFKIMKTLAESLPMLISLSDSPWFKPGTVSPNLENTSNIEFAVAALRKLVPSISGLFTVLGDISAAVKTDTDLAPLANLSKLLPSISSVISNLAPLLTSTSATIVALADSTSAILDLDTMTMARSVLGAVSQQLNDIAIASGGMGPSLEGIAKTSELFAKAKLGDFVTVLTATAQHIKTINTLMQNMDTVDIDATIDKFGKGMNVANRTVSINGGAVKVNVKLNLTIGAQKMAESLVMDGFVEGTPAFKEFIGEVDGIDDQFSAPESTRMRFNALGR